MSFMNGMDRVFTDREAARRGHLQESLREELVMSCRELARGLADTAREDQSLGEQILADERVTKLLECMSRLEVLGDYDAIEQTLAMLPPVVSSHLEPIFITSK